MKANEINLESILAKINPDDWGMAWEAIHNATTKEIDFATEASAITYCKTFIWATKYNEDILTRKKVVVDEDGNKKTVVIRAKRFISIEAEAEKRAGYEKIKRQLTSSMPANAKQQRPKPSIWRKKKSRASLICCQRWASLMKQ